MQLKVAGLVCILLHLSYAHKLPNNIQPCKSTDESCMIEKALAVLMAIKDGFKPFGLMSLEPLFVKTTDIAGNGGSVDLSQHYEDTNIHGLIDGMEFKEMKASLDGDDCHIYFVAHNPTLKLIGKHHMKGKLLLFQLNGKGNSNITLTDLTSTHKILCKKMTKKERTYLDVTGYELTLTPKKLYFDLENVIDGNAQLSAEVNKVANENDQEIFKEVNRDYERTFAEIFKAVVKQFFVKVPAEDAFQL